MYQNFYSCTYFPLSTRHPGSRTLIACNKIESALLDPQHINFAGMIDFEVQFVHVRNAVLQLLPVAQSALYRRSYNVNSTLTAAVCLQTFLILHWYCRGI
jgi:hypothetical protein